MIPAKFRILMNNHIDGLNTSAEGKQLEDYLREDPRARAYFEALCCSLELLNGCGEHLPDPPADLGSRIMQRLPAEGGEGASH